MKLNFKTYTNSFLEIDADASTGIEQIRETLAEKLGLQVNHFRLILLENKKAKVLQDNETVGGYNIDGTSKLHIILHMPGG